MFRTYQKKQNKTPNTTNSVSLRIQRHLKTERVRNIDEVASAGHAIIQVGEEPRTSYIEVRNLYIINPRMAKD